jgi:hypothetical protein
MSAHLDSLERHLTLDEAAPAADLAEALLAR